MRDRRGGGAVDPFERVHGPATLHEFLAGCDYLFAALPDTPATRGLLDADALRRLPAGCLLINVGRGSLLDEGALLEALHSGRLGGAVLDVFQAEPLPASHPFWSAPRLRITAHIAARSLPADIARVFLGNLRRFDAGEDLVGLDRRDG